MTILRHLLVLTLMVFGSSLQAQEKQNLEEMNKLINALLEEADGKLSPDIVEVLADSGALNSTNQKTGKWSEYYYKPCVLCQFNKLNYDSMVFHDSDDYGIFILIKESGEYHDNARTGVWVTHETYRKSQPFEWHVTAKVKYLNGFKEGFEERYHNDGTLYRKYTIKTVWKMV